MNRLKVCPSSDASRSHAEIVSKDYDKNILEEKARVQNIIIREAPKHNAARSLFMDSVDSDIPKLGGIYSYFCLNFKRKTYYM